MTLVSTGTFRAVARVKATNMQFVPVAPNALPNWTPFILNCEGRESGEDSDYLLIHEIAVEPAEMIDNATVSVVGSFAAYSCTTIAPVAGGEPLTITPFNSSAGSITGVTAWRGPVSGIGTKSLYMFNANIATWAPTLQQWAPYGPFGNFKESKTTVLSDTEPLAVVSGAAFQISRPITGTSDSAVTVTVMGRTSAGRSFLTEAISGAGSDILTIYNGSGSTIYITDVTVADLYKNLAVQPKYEIVVATSSIRVEDGASLIAHDSSKALPSWVSCGSGYYIRESTDTWIDYVEALTGNTAIPNPSYVGSPTARTNRPFQSGYETSKMLRPGKSLIFQMQDQRVMPSGDHDIIVTFSAYSDVADPVNTEYAYAY